MTIFSSIVAAKRGGGVHRSMQEKKSARCLQLPVKTFTLLKVENQVVNIICTNNAEGVEAASTNRRHFLFATSQRDILEYRLLCI